MVCLSPILYGQAIAKENVRGDNPNDANHPGGEAQLDVEYLLGIAR